MWQMCKTRSRSMVFSLRVSNHQINTSFIATGQRTHTQIEQSLELRWSRFSEHRKGLETRYQTTNTKKNWKSHIFANLATNASAWRMLTRTQPALPLAVCVANLNHCWWCISSCRVHQHCTTTRNQVPYQLLSLMIPFRYDVYYNSTHVKQNARSWGDTSS